jgi:hypothetical protein
MGWEKRWRARQRWSAGQVPTDEEAVRRFAIDGPAGARIAASFRRSAKHYCLSLNEDKDLDQD